VYHCRSRCSFNIAPVFRFHASAITQCPNLCAFDNMSRLYCIFDIDFKQFTDEVFIDFQQVMFNSRSLASEEYPVPNRQWRFLIPSAFRSPIILFISS
jgi:hypothetical protein